MQAPPEAQTSELAAVLRPFSIFGTLDSAALEQLTVRASTHRAPRMRLLVHEAQRVESLGVVVEGRVSVNIALRGAAGSVRPCMLYLVEPGSTFAEFSVLDGEPAIGDIVALTDVRYVCIPKDDVRAVMHRNQAFADAIAARGMSRARHSIRRLAGHLTTPMPVRVAQLLLPYAPQGPGLAPADRLLVRMTQAQLSAMTGSVKEVFARTVAELEALGALRREHGHIAYLDHDKLAALAASAPSGR